MSKPSYGWNEEDVLALIRDEVEESLYLDYKATPSLQKTDKRRTEIGKDVSAFANSQGGTILYGVAQYQDPARQHLPERINGGYDPAEISREWLEQVTNSRIQPRISGVRINSIPLGPPNEGRVIYAVYVPPSTRAHQASDKRYYKRFNFESVPMEDYEIQDIMNRRQLPIIEAEISFVRVGREAPRRTYRLLVSLHNSGGVRATDLSIKLWWPREIPQTQIGGGYRDTGLVQVEGRNYRLLEARLTKGETVVFPDESVALTGGTLDPFHIEYVIDERAYQNRDRTLKWIIYADDAPARTGEIPFTQLNDY